jgi:lipid II:glycine glycyltransferase (peptidoglycan interpeptide bridge formation enzyme)
VLDDLQLFARQQGAIFLKLDPDVVVGRGVPGTESDLPQPTGQAIQNELSTRGWQYSPEQIQFKNTVLVDVLVADEELLARMKQKTRYNVRLGPKKGLVVRVGDETDWPLLYKMYAETSVRDGFVIRDQAYYQAVWKAFANSSAALIAELEGQAIAAVYLFHFAGRAYYLYGMSGEAHRDLMPNYLLQFAAMRWARQQGCRVYDLWGAPEIFDQSDMLWGVFRFKEGLGGQVQRTLGAWDFAPNPLWYWVYTQVMPRLLDFMRSRGRQRTRQSLV